MQKKKLIILCLILLNGSFLYSQESSGQTEIKPSPEINQLKEEKSPDLSERRVTERKGKKFFSWGYNRGYYTQSDIKKKLTATISIRLSSIYHNSTGDGVSI